MLRRFACFNFSLAIVFALLALNAEASQTSLVAFGGQNGVRWQVWVDDKPLVLRHVTIDEKFPKSSAALRKKGAWYDYGTCLLTGPRHFVVRADRDISRLEVVPEKFGIVPKKIDDRTFSFEADNPFRLSFEVEGRVGALHLFAARPDALPDAAQPGVRRFGPGEHRPGTIYLGNDETLVLDEGAVVYGAVRIVGTNVVVCGTGILSGRDYKRFQRLDAPGTKPTIGFFGVRNARQVRIRDISIECSCSWTLVIDDSSDVSVDGVKILGSQMINDDGIDIVNSQHVTVSRTFVRTQDDGLALKGMSERKPMPPVSDIVMRDCEIWTDAANPFRFGCESHASAIRGICIEDTDVLRYSPYVLPVTNMWTHGVILLQPSNDMPLEGVVFRNVRIRDCGVREGLGEMFVLQAAPKLSGTFRPKTRYTTVGSVRGVRLENVTLDGTRVRADSRRVYCSEKNVSGVTIDGIPICAGSKTVGLQRR